MELIGRLSGSKVCVMYTQSHTQTHRVRLQRDMGRGCGSEGGTGDGRRANFPQATDKKSDHVLSNFT